MFPFTKMKTIFPRLRFPLFLRSAVRWFPQASTLFSASSYTLLSLLLLVCGPLRAVAQSDFDLRRSISGTWFGTNSSFSGTTTIRADRTFATRVTYNPPAYGPKSVEIDGRWQILDGYLIYTVTKTTEPEDEPVGHVDRYKIIRLNGTELTYKDEERDQVISLKRSEPKPKVNP